MKYKDWLKPENLILIEGWARDGLTNEEIAKRIGITVTTLYDWQKKYPKFSDSLKKGKEVVDYMVEQALLKRALFDGDVTAQIFWLKNRKKQWSDRKTDQNNNEVEDLSTLARLLNGKTNTKD